MAKSTKYLINYPADYTSFPEWTKEIYYGKCQTSPYVEKGLWFVSIPHGKYNDFKIHKTDISHFLTISPSPKIRAARYEQIFPEQDTTFLVEEYYTQINYFDQFRRDVKAWGKVAYKVFVGKWCDRYEKLWQDIQVQEYALPEKVGNLGVVKYGYCRTSSKGRDLWFVSFKDNRNGPDHTFIVDEICASPHFIEYLKTQPDKWMYLCWCYLRDEVRWENLKTGLDAQWLEHFKLDSPFSIAEIDETIKKYQNEISTNKRAGKYKKWW